MGYQYLFGCIFCTVYGQLILKWRIGSYGQLPDGFVEKIQFLARVLLDPFILSGVASAFLSSLFWIAAMTRFSLSYAYPFMSLSFVLILALSGLLFRESVDLYKLGGMILIVAGIFVSSRSLV